jgi:hypothetical protein
MSKTVKIIFAARNTSTLKKTKILTSYENRRLHNSPDICIQLLSNRNGKKNISFFFLLFTNEAPPACCHSEVTSEYTHLYLTHNRQDSLGEDQPITRPLPIQVNTNTEETQTYNYAQAGFEPLTLVFERSKIFRVQDSAAAAVSRIYT